MIPSPLVACIGEPAIQLVDAFGLGGLRVTSIHFQAEVGDVFRAHVSFLVDQEMLERFTEFVASYSWTEQPAPVTEDTSSEETEDYRGDCPGA